MWNCDLQNMVCSMCNIFICSIYTYKSHFPITFVRGKWPLMTILCTSRDSSVVAILTLFYAALSCVHREKDWIFFLDDKNSSLMSMESLFRSTMEKTFARILMLHKCDLSLFGGIFHWNSTCYKVTFGNKIFREKIFKFHKFVVNSCLAIVNSWGFGWMKILICWDFQIRPPPIRFKNPLLSGFVHLILFFLVICIDTHQY